MDRGGELPLAMGVGGMPSSLVVFVLQRPCADGSRWHIVMALLTNIVCKLCISGVSPNFSLPCAVLCVWRDGVRRRIDTRLENTQFQKAADISSAAFFVVGLGDMSRQIRE